MTEPTTADLGRAFDAVDRLVAGVREEQWAAPTPCTDWDVRRLVEHLIGMNRVFAAMLLGEPPPARPTDGRTEPDPVGAYRNSAAALVEAFSRPGALARRYESPLGSASGEERLQIRLYDLLAHGWDLAQATGQPADLPDDLAERALVFARTQLSDQSRPGRFAPAVETDDTACALDRLVAFLGRAPAREQRP